MSLDADLIVDRRRMRRKLTFWRVVTVLVVIVAVVGAGARVHRPSRRHHRRPRRRDRPDHHRGADPRQPRALRGAEAAGRIERQGGDRPHQQPGRHGGRLRGALRLADQGARPRSRWWWWWTASRPPAAISPRWRPTASWRSRARIVGSIGVIFQYPNVTELLKTIGVQVETIKSSPLKAAPSGYEPTSPEARAAVEAIVKDSFDWFKGLVRDRRHLDDAALAEGVRRPGVHRPAGGRAQADRRARRRAGGDRLAGEGEEHRPEDAGPRLSARARGSAICRSCTSPRSACSTRSASAAWPSGSRSSAPSRRSSG